MEILVGLALVLALSVLLGYGLISRPSRDSAPDDIYWENQQRQSAADRRDH